ncbi:MAG: radical SAM protein [Desulfobacterales bacterium]|nr:radical SAM protein [Desulfobacterales bacterium]
MKFFDHLKRFGRGGAPVFIPDYREMADPLPAELWIELTSKCPYSCIFCSRKTVRGAGEHMPMDLFASIIGQLQRPRVIRLNYSGESICHPGLNEAIRLAASTGAATELVSAFSIFPKERLEAFATSGLDRLTISLHTTDRGRYREIFGHGDFDALAERLARLRSIQKRLRLEKPTLDFAFVAMKQNLDQLRDVAAFAASMGGAKLDIHPVIRRDETPFHFDSELENGRLKPSFIKDLREKIRDAREALPLLPMDVSTGELFSNGELQDAPLPFPGPLPGSALIQGCPQDPWSTAHVLSNGDVVSCEPRDKAPLGNLATHSLEEVWRGEPYEAFRRGYIHGRSRECAGCVYKTAYRPGGLNKKIWPGRDNSRQLLKGWDITDEPHLWSMPESLAVLPLSGKDRLKFSGLLPRGAPGESNRLTILCNGERVGEYENRAADFMSIDDRLKIVGKAGPGYLRFRVKTPFRPADYGESEDNRLLGFALLGLRSE